MIWKHLQLHSALLKDHCDSFILVHLEKQEVHSEVKIYEWGISQGYGFSSGYVWMWELECEES